MKTSTSLIALIVVLILAGVGYAFYNSSSNSGKNLYGNTQSTATPVSETITNDGSKTTISLSISNSTFSSTPVSIHTGDSVTWTNKDTIDHTVTSTDNGPLDSGNLSKGQSYTYTFQTPGTYTYHCSYHSFMTGTVTVQ